jgi:6-phosphogluconolactonase (cycloisomerase 2 family)
MAACAYAATTSASSVGSFLVTNNDVPLFNPPQGPAGSTVSFYSIESSGALDNKVVIPTGGVGIAGGFFASSRIAIVPQGNEVCVFASNAASGDISGINAGTLTVTGTFLASLSDTATTNGIGLAANANYLYATYSTSSTIATFSVEPGCMLSFVGDVSTVGLNSGVVGPLAIHGSTMVVTYGDGSIESFNIAAGVPVSNGDAQNSSGFANDHLPNGVDITADGHYAIFGDASTVTTLEVSDISSGKLTPTIAYDVGKSWNSGNVRLTPDESLIIVSNNSGGTVTAAPFDKATGKIAPGCTSAPLKGFYGTWSYTGAAALQLPSALGGLIYVPEFGSNGYSSIGVVQLTVADKACTLSETASSPIVDNSDHSELLSIGVYPVRPF